MMVGDLRLMEEVRLSSCRLVVFTIVYRVLDIPGGAGFLPSGCQLPLTAVVVTRSLACQNLKWFPMVRSSENMNMFDLKGGVLLVD